MKLDFANVSAFAAKAVSPLSISYNDVAPDTKPQVASYLKGLDNNVGFKPQSLAI